VRHSSPILRRFIASIALAVVLVNCAQQCRAWCLITCCIEEARELASCQHSSVNVCTGHCSHHAQSRDDSTKKNSSRSESSHNPKPCDCCATPEPQHAPSVVDADAVVDGLLTVVDFYCVTFRTPIANAASPGLDDIASSCAFYLCVKLCRFVV
jgi:hypothetical protein